MKIRNGFVSNSSSSSFIVIRDTSIKIPKFDTNKLCFPADFPGSTTEFGWGPEEISDFASKVNFAYIQTFYINKERAEKWRYMIESVLIENIDNLEAVEFLITTEFSSEEANEKWGYIDHQSAACEGSNTEIFDSKEALFNFFFSEDSYIQLDNDNH